LHAGIEVQEMKWLGEHSCFCHCNTHCWLQDPLSSGTGWQQQQQESLYSPDHQAQQWPVQQGTEQSGDGGEL